METFSREMSSSSNAEPLRLPPVSPKAPSPSKIRGNKTFRSRLELPLLPAATKAERYTRLSHFDKSRLKRQKAHVRNALKTTENIQKISKQLNERLSSLGEDGRGKVSFERLAAHRDAFEALIKQSGEYAPMLEKIKDAYHHRIMNLLSQDVPVSMLPPPPRAHTPVGEATPTSGQDLEQLHRELHQLEIEYRVTTQQSKTLEEEVAREELIHERAMAELTQPIEITPPHLKEGEEGASYAAKVEQLQMMIADEQEAIAKVGAERKGRIPLSVCLQLEQCIREVDIEIQKQQRRNQKLKSEIEELSREVETAYANYGYSLSEVFTELGIQ